MYLKVPVLYCIVLYSLFFLQVHIQFVESMLTVHKKYKEVIQEVFHGDQNFIGALDKACSSVVNHRPNPKIACRSPEMVGIVYNNNISLCCSKLLELNPVFFNE
jgi:Cullin, a subunit of E3 ubiquitin ligase